MSGMPGSMGIGFAGLPGLRRPASQGIAGFPFSRSSRKGKFTHSGDDAAPPVADAGNGTGGGGAGMKGDLPFFASSKTVEHYTPRYIWERAVRTMGAIDVDPAADPGHQIPAATHYTKAE